MSCQVLQTDGRTDGQAQTNMPPQFFRSWGHNYKTEQNMKHIGQLHTRDHITEGHMHTDITTCNIEQPQQKCRLRTVSNRLQGEGGGGGLKLRK